LSKNGTVKNSQNKVWKIARSGNNPTFSGGEPPRKHPEHALEHKAHTHASIALCTLTQPVK